MNLRQKDVNKVLLKIKAIHEDYEEQIRNEERGWKIEKKSIIDKAKIK